MSASQRRWLLLALIGMALIAFFALDLGRFFSLDALREQRAGLLLQIEAHPILSAGIFFVVYVAVTALSLPAAALLTIAGGALFGFTTGTLLVSFASTLGATLAMLLARYLLRDSVQSRFGARLKAIDDGLAREGAFYLFALRLVPVFPFFLVNLTLGLTRLPARTFFWVSQIGMLPATAVYVYAGTEIGQLTSLKGLISPSLLGAFALLGLLPLITKKFLDALRARRVYQGHTQPKRYDYNLIAIGAGSAGLVTTYIGAAVKAKVALIERHKMGGDCLNTGCVPSKALIRTARLLAEARHSQDYGINAMHVEFDFATAMQRVQQVIAKVEPHDSVERYSSLGVDCIKGDARLIDPWTVEVEGRRLTARSIVIATGARPTVPKLPGIETVDYLTSDTVWNIRVQPKRLVVLGGGPIGCELGQCFARLGSAVTIVQRNPRLLPKEDPDASAAVRTAFEAEGIALALGAEAVRVEQDGAGGRLIVSENGVERAIEFDRLLLALGRTANVDGFGLAELGVRVSARGTVEADPLMRTSMPNIYVCGDVTGPYQFTHVAAHQAWYAAVNALFGPFWTFKVDYRVIPWATFTDPEVAHVGLSETTATEQGVAYEITHYGLDDLDRAIADSHDHGYV
jgi:pyruvate/2-oxoglutarate dehydrogenase complex dihydrolipoamide dehydrogenase (E3) component/uncharacterized membrane protein YdjX (TVP38/TMEM64 family)